MDDWGSRVAEEGGARGEGTSGALSEIGVSVTCGLESPDFASLFGIMEPKASSTACRKLVSVAGLADILPFNVLPLVLVAPRDFSLPTSSQSAARSSFLEKKRSVMEDLLPSSGRSGALVVDPELDEKSFLALNHFFTPSRVVGSLRMGVWVGVVGALDWGEGSEK